MRRPERWGPGRGGRIVDMQKERRGIAPSERPFMLARSRARYRTGAQAGSTLSVVSEVIHGWMFQEEG
jgi:hypothetical protein